MPSINYFKTGPLSQYYYFQINSDTYVYSVLEYRLSRISALPFMANQCSSPDLYHQELIDEMLTHMMLLGCHTVNKHDLYQ